MTVKILNLDELTAGTRVAGKQAGTQVPLPVEYDSGSKLFKILGGPGKYAVSIIANEDSLELPDTFDVKETVSKGCTVNNTVNIEVDVEASPSSIDSIKVRSKLESPKC